MQRILIAIALGTMVAAWAEDPIPAEIEWIKAHGFAFETVEAGHGFEDLQRLKAVIGDARIVALGECTHGSREIFRMKHRLTEFLATEIGFTIFSIEANMPEAYRVNDYVLGGDGDPIRLIRGMYFWTWSTEEVLDMVEWMRRFNAGGQGRIEFTGFDMQTPDVAMRIVSDFVTANEPKWLAELNELCKDARNVQAQASSFGVATGTFPLDVARGKKVRYTGWIKTSDLDGWAGLWWRVDGPDGSLAFDNMQDRAPKGSTGWKHYEIELEVPAEATNINFGVLMPGDGTAWFDDLRVELDGVAYENADEFDFDFESDRIRGFMARAPSYFATLDASEFKSGQQSLCLMKVPGPAGKTGADPTATAKKCKEAVAHLEANRERYEAEDTDWAIQNARVVHQATQMRAPRGRGCFVRDLAMAENVGWILKQNPGAKIVLWAHNSHISRQASMMGQHLDKRYRDDYLAMGFATRRGEYFAGGSKQLASHTLQKPPDDSIEHFLHAAGEPRLILDIRQASPGSPASGWLCVYRPFRSLGALAMKRQFHDTNVQQLYDVLIYIEDTTAAVQLAK